MLLITHGGTMHTDEVLATALLKTLFPSADVIRENNVENIEKLTKDIANGEDHIIYDIGGGAYDHHQKDHRIRDNGIIYSSFGLLWQKYGYDFLKLIGIPKNIKEKVFKAFDSSFVEQIDANDNGQGKPNPHPIIEIIRGFNPPWNDTAYNPIYMDVMNRFYSAYTIAQKVMFNIVTDIASSITAARIMSHVISRIEKDAKYLVLEEFVPWEEYIDEAPEAVNILYVIYPSNRNKWEIRAVRKFLHSFNLKKPLPEEWRGLKDTELVEASGISNATFVHPNGFIGAATTRTAAINMAIKAINNKE